MKFGEIRYERPDIEAAKRFYAEAARRLAAAESFEAAEAVFLEVEDFAAKLETLLTVAQIRHDMDTRDGFYDAEAAFIDSAAPELEEFGQEWNRALLATPYRAEFEVKYNRLMFLNTPWACARSATPPSSRTTRRRRASSPKSVTSARFPKLNKEVCRL